MNAALDRTAPQRACFQGDSSGESPPPEIDDDWPLELDDESWDALTPDDDYEPMPEVGDFWIDDDGQ